MSADLVVITPSRARPEQFSRLVAAVQETTDGRVSVIGCLDRADPQLDVYLRMPFHPPHLYFWTGQWRRLNAWTNWASQRLLDRTEPPRFLASVGDDHVPRTKDWDLKLARAAESVVGWSYGDDLFQRGALPTAFVVCASVVRHLGWMMRPEIEHLFTDNSILAIGQAAGRIAYVPGVIMEHMHPMAGKADSDPGYEEVYRPEQFQRDREAFQAWTASREFRDDVAKLAEVTKA